MFSKFFLIFTISILLYGCSPKTSNTQEILKAEVQADEMAVFKVFIDNEGKIEGDGKEMDLENLDKEFEEMKQRNGMVYYSREDINADSPEGMKVMELVVKHQLPIKFFTDETFSTPYNPAQ